MNTSRSSEPQAERRVAQYLDEFFGTDKDALIGASQVSAALDIPAADTRRILTDLAIRRILKPVAKMACVKCGAINDDAEEDETTTSCHVCGQATEHAPIVLFSLLDAAVLRQGDSLPKPRGRGPLFPPAPRPWFLLGAFLRRRMMA